MAGEEAWPRLSTVLPWPRLILGMDGHVFSLHE